MATLAAKIMDTETSITGNSSGKENMSAMKKDLTENPVYPTVPVEQAIEATKQWREFNAQIQQEFHLPPEYLNEYIRAFFIPASDIQAINAMIQSDDSITGCRVYLGVEPTDANQSVVGAELKLFIVAVQGLNPPGAPGSGMDIVYAPDTGDSMVYDFTCPCPSTCDINSVLYAHDSK